MDANQNGNQNPTHLFKDIRPWLLEKEPNKPAIACPVCIEQINPGQHWEETDNSEMDNEKEAILLVCGHILCEDCWRELIRQWHHRPVDQLNTPPRCPCCREQSCFEQCGHVILQTTYVSTSVDKRNWRALPPTMTEEGGRKPQSCNTCRGEQLVRIVEHAASRLGIPFPKLVRAREDEPILELTTEEREALIELRAMWRGEQDRFWSEEWEVPGLGLMGVI
ncbi:hypothetical protein N656DRAFT_448916 [Canariomyces notabilis]|uniref:RING-type domain-containing protein n=1 Tax=Canariomyces notabilis TaxID=2074819 RepID=A0AAN6QIF6_9PEZI|nr:hypothetical protein N656DRAFT_448916 [Canariomyces arenarius]